MATSPLTNSRLVSVRLLLNPFFYFYIYIFHLGPRVTEAELWAFQLVCVCRWVPVLPAGEFFGGGEDAMPGQVRGHLPEPVGAQAGSRWWWGEEQGGGGGRETLLDAHGQPRGKQRVWRVSLSVESIYLSIYLWVAASQTADYALRTSVCTSVWHTTAMPDKSMHGILDDDTIESNDVIVLIQNVIL